MPHDDTDELPTVRSRDRPRRKFGVSGLKSLGGFKNVRDVHDWKGLQVEVDETKYPWGTVYELECETVSSLSLPLPLSPSSSLSLSPSFSANATVADD